MAPGGRRWLELFNCAKFNQKENLEGCESLDSAAENIQADTRVFFYSIIVCLVSLYQFTRVNTWKRSCKSALFIISRPLDIAGADSNSSLSPSHCLCGMEWLNSAWTTSNCVILSKTLTDKHLIHFEFRMLSPVLSLSHFSLFVRSVVAIPYLVRNILLDVSWGYFPFSVCANLGKR